MDSHEHLTIIIISIIYHCKKSKHASCSHLFVSVHRRFGTKCGGCSLEISPNELVRRARSRVYHLKCFTCLVCRKQLSTGEELYMLDENRFICKEDYISKFQSKFQTLIIWYLISLIITSSGGTTDTCLPKKLVSVVSLVRTIFTSGLYVNKH